MFYMKWLIMDRSTEARFVKSLMAPLVFIPFYKNKLYAPRAKRLRSTLES